MQFEKALFKSRGMNGFMTKQLSLWENTKIIPGQVSQQLLKSYKGKPLSSAFWEKIAWSRVVGWGKNFEATKNYVEQNRQEFNGEISYKPRKDR